MTTKNKLELMKQIEAMNEARIEAYLGGSNNVLQNTDRLHQS